MTNPWDGVWNNYNVPSLFTFNEHRVKCFSQPSGHNLMASVLFSKEEVSNDLNEILIEWEDWNKADFCEYDGYWALTIYTPDSTFNIRLRPKGVITFRRPA